MSGFFLLLTGENASARNCAISSTCRRELVLPGVGKVSPAGVRRNGAGGIAQQDEQPGHRPAASGSEPASRTVVSTPGVFARQRNRSACTPRGLRDVRELNAWSSSDPGSLVDHLGRYRPESANGFSETRQPLPHERPAGP